MVIMVTVVIMGWAAMATTMGEIVIGVTTTTMAVTTLTVTGCGILILTSMYGPVNQWISGIDTLINLSLRVNSALRTMYPKIYKSLLALYHSTSSQKIEL